MIKDQLAVITPILLALAGTLYPPTLDEQTLIDILGSDPVSFWKIIVRTFVHGDLFHFASNSLVFYFCTKTLLNQINVRKATLLFFTAAVVGALTEFYASGNITIGMSGAVMAVFSFNIIVCLRKHLSPYYYLFVLVFPLQDITGITTESEEPIAFWAHLGGFVVGLGFAMFFYRNKPFGVLRA